LIYLYIYNSKIELKLEKPFITQLFVGGQTKTEFSKSYIV